MRYTFKELLLDQIVSGAADKQQYAKRLHMLSQLTDSLRYLTGEKITILHRLSPDDTRTVIAKDFPEKLTVALWPGAEIGYRPDYGRALLWQFEADAEGLAEAHGWILKAVKDGHYDDLSGLSFRAQAIMQAMNNAAKAMQITKLSEIAKAGLRRIKTEEQLDASQSVDQ